MYRDDYSDELSEVLDDLLLPASDTEDIWQQQGEDEDIEDESEEEEEEDEDEDDNEDNEEIEQVDWEWVPLFSETLFHVLLRLKWVDMLRAIWQIQLY